MSQFSCPSKSEVPAPNYASKISQDIQHCNSQPQNPCVNVRNNCTDNHCQSNHQQSNQVHFNSPSNYKKLGQGEKPNIKGCALYESDCNVPPNLCKMCPEICVNDYWFELNNRLGCNSYMFDRWKTIYQMTTDEVGRQLMERKADCRRKPFYPRRCKLCDINDDIYITEQLCKRYVTPKCPSITCYGDYLLDKEEPKVPPGMIMTTPQHCARHKSTQCFKKIPDPRLEEINDLLQYVRRPEDGGGNMEYRKH